MSNALSPEEQKELDNLRRLVADGFPLSSGQRLRKMALQGGSVTAGLSNLAGQVSYMRKISDELDRKGVVR